MTNSEKNLPAIGGGATMAAGNDSYPYVISRVSPSGKTVWLLPLVVVSKATGHSPAAYGGGMPIWTHIYTEEERATMVRPNAQERMARLGKDGRWRSNGVGVGLGSAVYHRDDAHI